MVSLPGFGAVDSGPFPARGPLWVAAIADGLIAGLLADVLVSVPELDPADSSPLPDSGPFWAAVVAESLPAGVTVDVFVSPAELAAVGTDALLGSSPLLAVAEGLASGVSPDILEFVLTTADRGPLLARLGLLAGVGLDTEASPPVMLDPFNIALPKGPLTVGPELDAAVVAGWTPALSEPAVTAGLLTAEVLQGVEALPGSLLLTLLPRLEEGVVSELNPAGFFIWLFRILSKAEDLLLKLWGLDEAASDRGPNLDAVLSDREDGFTKFTLLDCAGFEEL